LSCCLHSLPSPGGAVLTSPFVSPPLASVLFRAFVFFFSSSSVFESSLPPLIVSNVDFPLSARSGLWTCPFFFLVFWCVVSSRNVILLAVVAGRVFGGSPCSPPFLRAKQALFLPLLAFSFGSGGTDDSKTGLHLCGVKLPQALS